MTFDDIALKLIDAMNNGYEVDDWPEMIAAPVERVTSGIFGSKNEFWSKIEDLHKFTISYAQKFRKEYQGSTGWEYEMMMAFVYNKFYYSTSTSKDYEQVRHSHSLKIDTKFDKNKQIVTDTINLSGKKAGSITWANREKILERNKLIDQGKFKYGLLCHFHTHPLSQYPTIDKKIYSFFSDTDINSFLSSRLKITGLITNKLWLLAKTSKSTIPSSEELGYITKTEAFEPENLGDVACEVMNKHGIVLYSGEFGKAIAKL